MSASACAGDPVTSRQTTRYGRLHNTWSTFSTLTKRR
jgi:hypothetical protein